MHGELHRLMAGESWRELRDMRAQATRTSGRDRGLIPSLRRSLAGRRLRRLASEARGSEGAVISLRRASASDTSALARLEELGERPLPGGPVLVAEVDERLVAAVGLDGGELVVDPFVHSTGAVVLLRLRAGQIAAAERAA